MYSESDDDDGAYTVHEVSQQPSTMAPQQPQLEVAPKVSDEGAQPTTQKQEALAQNATAAPSSSSPLARYYRLGTQQRHAFDEHMRRLREETLKSEQERLFRQSHPFRPSLETGDTKATASVTDETTPRSHLSASLPSTGDRNSTTVKEHKSVVDTAQAPVKHVFDRLAAQALQLELRRRHREEQKRRAEAAALREAFQPEINRRLPDHANQLQHLDGVPVEERLLHYGETVARERQRRQETKALEEQAALLKAQRNVVGGGRDADGQPVDSAEQRRQRREFEERNARFLASRVQHRQRAEQEASEAFTFQPQISATSAALDEARRQDAADTQKTTLQELLNRSTDGVSLSVSRHSSASASLGGREGNRRSDALYAQALARQQRQESEARSRDGATNSPAHRGSSSKRGHAHSSADTSFSIKENYPHLSTEVPHQPQTNPNSEKWIAGGAHRHFFEHNFVERQTLYEKVREEELALRAAADAAAETLQSRHARFATASEGATSTNTPPWRSESGEACSTVPSPQKLHTQDLNQRLYYNARKASEVAERRREATVHARECPFRPELSPGTHYVLQHMKHSRDTNVVRRLTNPPQRTLTVTASAADGHRRSEAEALYASAPRARSSRKSSVDHGGSPLSPSASPRPREAGSASQRSSSASHETADTVRLHRKRSVVTQDQVENFYQRQMNALQQREDLIQERKEGEAVQELLECTFRPRTNADTRDGKPAGAGEACVAGGASSCSDGRGASVGRVTGVSEFLKRHAMARQRKAEHEEALRTMGLPRHTTDPISGGGNTVLLPFQLKTEQRRRRSSASRSRDANGLASRFPKQLGNTAGSSRATPLPPWMHVLTSAERDLYDTVNGGAHIREGINLNAVEELAKAPLFPLPGYALPEAEIDGDEGAAAAATYAEEDFAGPEFSSNGDSSGLAASRPAPHPPQPYCCRTYRHTMEEEERDRAYRGGRGARDSGHSLFSSLSPNAFSGRHLSLGAHAQGSGHAYAFPVRSGVALAHDGSTARVPAAPALKSDAAVPLTASAQRRKQKRSVSFVEDSDRISPRPSSVPSPTAWHRGRLHVDPTRLVFPGS